MPYKKEVDKLKDRLGNPGPVEGTDSDDQFLDFVDGLIRLTPVGPAFNPFAKRAFKTNELNILDQLLTGFRQALLEGKAALERGPSGNMVPALGPTGHPNAQLMALKSVTYVKLKKHWWGFRIYLSHACVDDLVTAGSGAAAILTACGVSAWIAALVAACVAAIKGFDRGNGVTLSFSWSGALIWIRSGKHL
jgi:hypothetical protein